MTETGIWLLGISGVCWLLAMHPFVTYPISLIIFRGRRVQVFRPSVTITDSPSIAICTCAYNEAKVIESKILNLLALKESYKRLEILLYVDASSDGTAEIAAKYSEHLTLVMPSDRHGKTHGMNRLVSLAQSELIVFTDANVQLDVQALANLATHFEDERVGCVCGNLEYTNAADSVTAATGSMYWRLEQWIKRRESRSGSVMGADGSMFAIRRSLHRPPPDDIIDDMYLSFIILCAGYWVIQATDVRAFEESVVVAAEEFRRKIRIACQAFNVHRLLWRELRSKLTWVQMYMYLSHKFLRWFCIYFILMGAASLLAGLAVLKLELPATLITVTSIAGLWAGGRWQLPLVTPINDLLVALAGAGIGVFRSLGGDRFQTWQPAASIRR